MVPTILFAIAAALGVTLAGLHFTRKPLPMALALLHGLFAAAGILALLAAGVGGNLGEQWKLSAALFIAAALGGFFLFVTYLKRKNLPSAVVVIHGSVAVIGFVLLLMAVFR